MNPALPRQSRRALVGCVAAFSVLGVLGVPLRRACASEPLRVISVGGSLTEIVFALGAGDRLVGTDTTSMYPAGAQALPKVGYQRTLSAEGVLSLRPSLVLATAEAGPPAALQQLASSGVRLVRATGDHNFESVVANVGTVADALGLPAAGRALEAKLRSEWAATQAAVAARAGGARPRVLFILSHAANNVQVSGTGTAADAMIRYAGSTNAIAAIDGGFKGYRPLAAEAVIAAAPDVILTTREGLEAIGGVDALLKRPGLALTPAGRAKRVVAPDALLLLGFGPRLPQAVRELAQSLGTAA